MAREFRRNRYGQNLAQAGGPYEAIVVNHLDPNFMGALEVELLKNTGSGNNPERTGQLFQVRYLSPFFGSTPMGAQLATDGYDWTQKSYGFWAVPPDIGTKVLVIFAEGNSAYGYWIGCIPDNYMNFMVPDGRPATELTTDATPSELKGLKLPVAEYNKSVEDGIGKDPTKFLKPYQKDFVQVLEIQGLLVDESRGLTTSSARREVPSQVFGINTPGPYDKRAGAPKVAYGPEQSKVDMPGSRLGGTSLVMDDGDDKFIRATHATDGPPNYINVEAGQTGGDSTIPHNELFRIRTRTGHQILLHNSEDLIYIANSRGTAWIELTSDGKIDIHASDSISLMTQTDFNITAERDINMEAGRNINMKATARYSNGENYDPKNNESGRIQMESAYDFNLDIGADGKITTNANGDFRGRLEVSVAEQMLIDTGREFSADAIPMWSPSVDYRPGDVVKYIPGTGQNTGAQSRNEQELVAAQQAEAAQATYASGVTDPNDPRGQTQAPEPTPQPTQETETTYDEFGDPVVQPAAQQQVPPTGSETATGGENAKTYTAIANNLGKAPDLSPDAWEEIGGGQRRGSFHVTAGGEIRMASASETHIKATGSMYVDTAAEYHVTSASNMFIKADANMDLYTAAEWKSHSGARMDFDAGASMYHKSGSNINLKAAGVLAGDAAEIHWNSGIAGSAATAAEATLAQMARNATTVTPLPMIPMPYITMGSDSPFPYNSIVPRAPQHEPWPHHENLAPSEFKPDKTDRESPGQLPNKSHPVTTDTFRKNTTTATPAGGSGVGLTGGPGTGLSSSGRGTFNQPVRDPLAPTVDRTTTSQGQSSPPGQPLATSELVGIIDGFNEEQTAAYLGAVGYRESTNRYNLVNSIGFAGKYQFGAAALKEAGMLKPTASNRNSAMDNPANWTGQYGCNNKQDWLANVGNCQEFAMITYTNTNRRYLLNNGGIRGSDTIEQQAGMLMGAHLLGAGGMRNWRRGNGGTDAYGTTGDEYYEIGSTAVANVSGGGTGTTTA